MGGVAKVRFSKFLDSLASSKLLIVGPVFNAIESINIGNVTRNRRVLVLNNSHHDLESDVKRLIIDLDNTIAGLKIESYADCPPDEAVIARMRECREQGFEIVVYTSRNMRTYAGSIGKINVVTLPVIIAWLDKHEVPYDEIVVGKPWCGYEGFYVDDRAIRPDEFVRYSLGEIAQLLAGPVSGNDEHAGSAQ